MREMKDSGIPWIGKVPSNWLVEPILSDFVGVTRKNKFGREKKALKFTYGEIVPKANFDADNDNYVADTILNYTIVEPGTIMLNGLNLNYDFISQRIGLVKQKGVITSAYTAFKPINMQKISSKYSTYLFKAYDNCKAFHNMGGGVRKILNFKELSKQPFIHPPIGEQRRIADYLDTKCARIDSIRKNVESEIEALKQYKKSVITEAVTKGLNKNVEMKDSGIPWIGKIPKNWKTGKIKYIADYSLNYPIGDGDHGLIKSSDYQIEGIPYIRVLNLTWGFGLDLTNIVYISEKQNRSIQGSQLKPDDILIAKTGATIGKTAIVPATLPISNTTSHVGKISVSKEHCAMYFYYQMNSSIVQKQVYDISSMQSTRPELGIEGLKNLAIVIPPKLEQEKISAYIQDEVIRINLIIKQKKGVLTNLDSYKKSLIYEYVTGKKEVPTV